MSAPLLFRPLELRGVTVPNRVMVSPMCTYAAHGGIANDFHLVHLGRLALGGAGLVVAEATAVESRGRISHGDLGLWSDLQMDALRPVSAFLKGQGAVAGIQLAHAGRKASTQAPWDGAGPLTEADAVRGEPPWPVVGPTAEPAGPGWQAPSELTEADIAALVLRWADAAARAVDAGFELIDIHGAHGYLLHSFLSPVSNHRADGYGGAATARMRLAIEVVEAIRAAVPDDVPILYRTSTVDGIDGGLTIDDTIAFARELRLHGVDAIDCSSGGVSADRSSDTRVRRGYAFHTPYSAAIRRALDMPVATVGLIVDPEQAEAILQHGDADLIAIGREVLAQPNWPHLARERLIGPDFDQWHKEAGWWLDKRLRVLRHLDRAGETPLTRYSDARQKSESLPMS
ncbi:NADH:flavin oxidoreductase/NADH oxidase [Phytohabitans suffuscus]|uniref:NADH:flavin oxidoreductase / NADH oxidase n=1 Tax=Phytohabitans suffuscus TaxID=624315 RepID=A0A6F8YR97_9ACTN|nr:NADH:flavin oxidoreductase/NADH oxidase [Phytohabitans suffuscus]BCB88624.1 NADH:flavin oxidoreductase / NADH oxidase [Phytohabitans suffuscus]